MNLVKKIFKSKVRAYTDKQLLDIVKQLPNYTHLPDAYFIIGVRSSEDTLDSNDDKFYLFNAKQKCVLVAIGTTNPGKVGLLHYEIFNINGVAVLMADHCHYDLWEQRMHRKKVWAWCQRIATSYFRDNDGDQHTEQLGNVLFGQIGINFHPQTYRKDSTLLKQTIGEWSVGCQCPANRQDFNTIMKLTKEQTTMSYFLLNEF
jgi:hypothetical protein